MTILLHKHQKLLIFLFTLLKWGRKLALHIYFVQSSYVSSMVIRKELSLTATKDETLLNIQPQVFFMDP